MPVRSRTARAGAAVVVLGIALAPTILTGTPAQADSVMPPTVDFYDAPPGLDSVAPGTLVESEESKDVLLPFTDIRVDAEVTRIMYTSTGLDGEAIPVTGTILEPTTPWIGGKPRPLIALAPGTQGLGDQCAPSKLIPLGQEYENLQITPLLAQGYSVAVTDYVGLGTEGIHPYLNRELGGRALLDLARAALSARPDVDRAATPVGLWGYSEGGHAAGAAVELADEYAPELPLVGAFVGAPAPDLLDLAELGDGSLLSGGLGWVVAGLAAAYPNKAEEILGTFNRVGRELIARTSTACIYDALSLNPFVPTTFYTVDGRPILDHLSTDPWRSLVDDQRLGDRAPSVPVFLASNTSDDFVAYRGTKTLGDRWQAGGGDVTRQDLHLPPLLPGTGLGHVLGLVTAGPAMQWMHDRITHTELSTP